MTRKVRHGYDKMGLESNSGVSSDLMASMSELYCCKCIECHTSILKADCGKVIKFPAFANTKTGFTGAIRECVPGK